MPHNFEKSLHILNNLKNDNVSSSITIASSMIKSSIELFSYEYLKKTIEDIIHSQPSMAAVINIGCEIIKAVDLNDLDYLLDVKRKFEYSLQNAAVSAYKQLKGIRNIATISYSKNVFDAVVKIKPKKVFLSVSHPAKEGEMLALQLKRNDIEPVLLEDSAYMHIFGDVEAVLVGADAVFENEFVNKTGTFCLALLAEEFNVPFYVISCECKYLDKDKEKLFRINDMPEDEVSGIDCKRINRYFEKVPLKYVNKMFVR